MLKLIHSEHLIIIGPMKGVGVSSVKVKFLAMPGVDLKMGVSSVDFTVCSPVAYLPHLGPM